MNSHLEPNQDVDALLHDAGARWRSEQVFESVPVGPRVSRRTGMVAPMAVAVGIVAIGAAATATTIVLRPRTDVGGQASAPAASSAGPSLGAAALEAAQIAVIEAVNADPTNFGGTYIDSDGTLVIQYFGANVGRPTVEKAITPGLVVRWEPVKRTGEELTRIHDAIVAAWPAGVFSVGIDTSRNQVVVTLMPGRPVGDVSDIVAAYGDAVRVETLAEIPVTVPGQVTTAP